MKTTVKRIITTHTQADFDSVASMVACRKLHPDFAMVFSGSQEKPIRHYLKKNRHHFSFYNAKEVNAETVEEIILVDTQTTTRLGKFNEKAVRSSVVTRIYDHHTEAEAHYPDAEKIIRKRGSTTTLLVELLSERNIRISPEEANLFLLGIYQDTANLTSVTTTKEDFLMAGELLSCGGEPHLIAPYLHDEMDSEEYALITTLLDNLETYHIGGYRINICTARHDTYKEGLAQIANKIKRLHHDDITILIVEMDATIHFVGRNSLPDFPLPDIFKQLGGGGHYAACSANLNSRNKKSLSEVKEEVVTIVAQKVSPGRKAAEVMTTPAFSIELPITILEAEKRFHLYGKAVLPVSEGRNIVGLLHKKDVEQGVRHRLGELSIETILDSDFSPLFETDPFEEAQNLIINFKQALVPVLKKEDASLAGVITQSDILNALYGKEGKTFQESNGKERTSPRKKICLEKRVKEDLSPEIQKLFEEIAEHAESLEMRAYLVGGMVRDLLIGRENKDIDIVIEGDGIHFATSFAKRFNLHVKTHEAFKTATVVVNRNLNFDVATARIEFYKSPAALPEVEESSLKMDLTRRDFTINALALSLNKEDPYQLIDYFDARQDIKRKKIRTLTKLSFVEDPTRAFRAVKFEQRLHFQLAKQTEKMLRLSVSEGHFKNLSIKRIFNELLQILKEENPIWGIRRLEELHIPKVISPSLHVDEEMLNHLKGIRDLSHWFSLQNIPEQPRWELLYCNIFLRRLKEEEREHLIAATSLKQKEQTVLRWHPAMLHTLAQRWQKEGYSLRHPHAAPFSYLYRSFSHLSLELLVLFIENLPDVKERAYLAEYLRRYFSLTLHVSGDEIAKQGIPPSPLYTTLQEEVKEAEIDGIIHTEEEKKNFLRRRIAQHKEENAKDNV